MIRNRKLRRQWFYHCLAWSCLGPAIWVYISNQQLVPSIVCGLFSGPPMAIGLYSFIYYIAPATKRLNFAASLIIQMVAVFLMLSISFTLGIAAIDSVMHGTTPLDPRVWTRAIQFYKMGPAITAYRFTLVFIFLLLLFWQVSRKFGPKVLFNWVRGYYHRPREEERIFMFLDIRGSTTLAEKMGHLKFGTMIQEFFQDMTNPLVESGGVVSHYIGDEAVLTWQLKDGLKNSNCLWFFFRMQSEIESRANSYRERFGVVPEFKAGLHYGHVVACEVGYVKSEVVYLGDVLNTTARIQGLCDSLGSPLLVSSDLISLLKSHPGLDVIDKGPQELKGKAEPITVYAVAESA